MEHVRYKGVTMSLLLKPTQICPYRSTCKYAYDASGNFCQGTVIRDIDFVCDYVNDRGEISNEGKARLSQDRTGRMKVIME